MRIILFICLTFCLGQCWSIDTKRNFLLLDKLLFSNLDSAKQVLLEIDGYSKQLSTAENGELGAKWGVFYALSGNNTKALAAFWRAYSFTNNTSLKRASMLKNLANVYKSMANYKQAEKMLKASLKIYISKGEKLDELIVLGELASTAYYQMLWEQAISLNLKVIGGVKLLHIVIRHVFFANRSDFVQIN